MPHTSVYSRGPRLWLGYTKKQRLSRVDLKQESHDFKEKAHNDTVNFVSKNMSRDEKIFFRDQKLSEMLF